MKRLLPLFICMVSAAITMNAQTDIQMNILHKSGTENFEYGMSMTNNLGYDYNVSRLEYYVSDIVLVHDGSVESPVEDLVILANGDNIFSIQLGNHDITNLESVKFHVGVNPDLNHLDPATYDAGHPLALHDPTMHWGWASGYKFVAVEGMANGQDNYEYHGLGDANYFEVEVPVDLLSDNAWMEINLLADVGRIFENMDLSSEFMSHGETGQALNVLENMRDYVFNEHNNTTSVDEHLITESVSIYPNPSSNGSTNVLFDSGVNSTYELQILNIVGQEIKRVSNLSSNISNEILIDKAGLYLFNIQTSNGESFTKRVVIQ